ncbi:GAF and ANTAR domain-containing protein [Microbacterium sp.]|uniref:GAF and ANTAR domain-containing protein n=1 Tax=Microbacterium sp. TaxID=51671 RepID=UPI002E2EB9D9|nr:GAF and ANTAR domain-containing protein [Microbacterium sp.]HEX5729646.1 GAF and ANTAR domain-containing protein [Microbacterium sp.]
MCGEFVSALPVQHAAISTLGDPFEVETVCSSDPLAARLDELQLDFGEGPCWQARATRSPVLLPDLQAPLTPAWPVVQAALASHQVRAAYAFPMSVGTLDIGAVDLYAARPDALSQNDVATASAMADAAALQVLRHTMAHRDDPHRDDPSSRRTVHQATGMVIAQMRIPADDALLVIRAHAFAADRSVAQIAADVVERRLDFSN